VTIASPWGSPKKRKKKAAKKATKKKAKKAPARKKKAAKKKAPARKKAPKKKTAKKKAKKAKKAKAKRPSRPRSPCPGCGVVGVRTPIDEHPASCGLKRRRRKKVTKKAKKKVTKKKAKKKTTRRAPAPVDFDTPPEWQGVRKDLRTMVNLLNKLYFEREKLLGKRPIVIEEIKWGRIAISRWGSCRYYRGGPKGGQVSIILNGQLKHGSVPTMVAAFTLFHEMVHAYCFKTGEGEGVARPECEGHNRQFRIRESLFRGMGHVKKWRSENAHKVFGDLGGCAGPKTGHLASAKHGDTVYDTIGRPWTLQYCLKNWVYAKNTRGTMYRLRPHQVRLSASANPAGIPELENDAEIVEWRPNPPGAERVTGFPELEDDTEVLEWSELT
jgi:hypothetical protein